MTRNPNRLVRIGRELWPTCRYWMETEVHVYAFSIAANVLLSFFPFLIVMISLCHYVLHWKGAEDAIMIALKDYFPDQFDTFIWTNLRFEAYSQGNLQFFSVFLLLFTANGIFEPLEVALNRAWGVKENRSFLKNQLVSLGLIFACGALVLLSTVLTAINREGLAQLSKSTPTLNWLAGALFFKAAAVPISILMLFLIYWILPNRRLSAKSVVAPAIIVGLLLELLKHLNLLTWPWLRAKLTHEYGPFKYSVTIILWSFFASLVILAGAEWSARHGIVDPDYDSPAAQPPEARST